MDDYYSYRNLLTYSTSICCKDSTQSVLSNNTLTEICQVTTIKKQNLPIIFSETAIRKYFFIIKNPLRGLSVPFLGHFSPLRGLKKVFLGLKNPLRSLSVPFLGHFSPLRGLKNPLRSLSVPFLGQIFPLRGLFSEKYSLIYFISLLKPAVIARIFTETTLFLGEFVLSKRIVCQY